MLTAVFGKGGTSTTPGASVSSMIWRLSFWRGEAALDASYVCCACAVAVRIFLDTSFQGLCVTSISALPRALPFASQNHGHTPSNAKRGPPALSRLEIGVDQQTPTSNGMFHFIYFPWQDSARKDVFLVNQS